MAADSVAADSVAAGLAVAAGSTEDLEAAAALAVGMNHLAVAAALAADENRLAVAAASAEDVNRLAAVDSEADKADEKNSVEVVCRVDAKGSVGTRAPGQVNRAPVNSAASGDPRRETHSGGHRRINSIVSSACLAGRMQVVARRD